VLQTLQRVEVDDISPNYSRNLTGAKMKCPESVFLCVRWKVRRKRGVP